MKDLEKVLDAYVRPSLRAHEGGMEVISYEDGVLRFRLQGKCAGCPAADMTTEDLINEKLAEHMPGFKEAILVNDVSEDLLEQARAILNGHKPE